MSARHAVRPALLRLRLQIRLHDASARLEVSQVRGQSARREAARQCRARLVWMEVRQTPVQKSRGGGGVGVGWGVGGGGGCNPMTSHKTKK